MYVRQQSFQTFYDAEHFSVLVNVPLLPSTILRGKGHSFIENWFRYCLLLKDVGSALHEMQQNVDPLIHNNNLERRGGIVTFLSERKEAENCLGCHGKLPSLREMLANRLYLQCRMFTVLRCNYRSMTGRINQSLYVNQPALQSPKQVVENMQIYAEF